MRRICSPPLIVNKQNGRLGRESKMPPTKFTEFDGEASVLLKKYWYQLQLTTELDNLGATSFTPELLNKSCFGR